MTPSHRNTEDVTVVGELVGSYEVKEKLAEGGMGAVYRAQHQLIGKSAAVKVLLPELSTNQDVVNRFFNEAKAATAIRHPGIVEIFDFGYLPSGMAYIVMELLDGEPLTRRLATQKRLAEHEALAITRGIASALAAAHDKGIVHRDLKPDNVFLVPDPDMAGGERPKLLDFGIAKVAEAQRGEASKTRTGAVMGTPTYMSPEQCKGAGEVDHRSDLYALGCILYEMLTGRPPFRAEGIGEIIGAHLFMDPEPPSSIVPEISASTEQLTLALLNKLPEDRVQSARELARLLGQATPSPFSAGTSSAMPIAVKSLQRSTPVAVKVPTTLGASSGQLSIAGPLDPAPARRGRWLLLGGVGAVAAGVAVFVAISAARGGEPHANAVAEPPVQASQALADAGVAVPATVAVPADAAAAEPELVPAVAAAPPDAGVPAVDAATKTTRKRSRVRDRTRTQDKRDGKHGTGSAAAAKGSGTTDAGTRDRFDRGD